MGFISVFWKSDYSIAIGEQNESVTISGVRLLPGENDQVVEGKPDACGSHASVLGPNGGI